IRITLPLTPPPAPTTSASDGLASPHTSRFLLTAIGSSLGGVPTNFTTPLTTPPSATAASSYAAPTVPGNIPRATSTVVTRRSPTVFERGLRPRHPSGGEAGRSAPEARDDRRPGSPRGRSPFARRIGVASL